MHRLIPSFLLLLCVSFSAQAQLEVMTYNIRYANENDGENSWSKRKTFITNQIQFYEPDIFGVQEALFKQMEYFDEHLNGYEYVGVGRDDGKTEGEYSAIFYKEDQFEVLKKNTFWLSETPTEISVGWDAALERICTYALFEDKNSGEKFWMFNTHFDHRGEKARKESAKLILAKIKELNTENFPVILTGDFNLEPSSKPIKILSDQMNDSKTTAKKVSFGSVGTFNGFKFHEPVKNRIDYIFTSKDNIEVLKYGVLTDSKDLRYPSDHFPILVKLRFE